MKFLIPLLIILSFHQARGEGQNCIYTFDIPNSVVEGTGYKFTEKKGVTAKFPGVTLNKKEGAKTPEELLKGLKVRVNLMSLDSGNEWRDKNLRETLFNGILGDSVAQVTVKSVKKGQLETELQINQKTQPMIFDYQFKGEAITATGSFDILSFAMGDQIAALKKRCGALHTGKDKKSVTWTDFTLSVKAKLKKNCQKGATNKEDGRFPPATT